MSLPESLILHSLRYIRAHGFACGYGNGRIAIAMPYTHKRCVNGRYVVSRDIETLIVKPTYAAVRRALGY